jgi:hypothetical protein
MSLKNANGIIKTVLEFFINYYDVRADCVVKVNAG